MSVDILSVIVSVIGTVILPIVFNLFPNKKDNTNKTTISKNVENNLQTQIIKQKNSNYQNDSNFQFNSNYQKNSNNTVNHYHSNSSDSKSDNSLNNLVVIIFVLIFVMPFLFIKLHSVFLFLMVVLFSLCIGFPKNNYKKFFKNGWNIAIGLLFITSMVFYIFPIDLTHTYIEFLKDTKGLLKFEIIHENIINRLCAALQLVSSVLWVLLLFIDFVSKITAKPSNTICRLSITHTDRKCALVLIIAFITIMMTNLFVLISF